VERIACIWQDLHPGNDQANWLDPNNNPENGQNHPEDADPTADLWPFHLNDTGRHYTSNDIRDWRPLGYTYPGLEKWLDKYKKNGKFDEQTYVTSIRSQMDVLYSTTAQAVLHMSRHAVAAEAHLPALSKETQRPVFAELAKSTPEKAVAKGSGDPPKQHPIVVGETKEVKKVADTQVAAGGLPTAGVGSTTPEKWEDNDYVVNVIYEK
jgi:hypothetical protein